jgi:LEA14-like dessication related protein
MRKLFVVAAVASLAAGVACAHGGAGKAADGAPPFYRPKVSLRDVRPSGVGITGGSLDVELKVFNPNLYAVEQPRVVYRVMVDTIQIAKGLADADMVIPAGDSATLRLPATFAYSRLGQAGVAMMQTGSVNYRVIGDMAVETQYGRYTFPFDRAGWFASLTAVQVSR